MRRAGRAQRPQAPLEGAVGVAAREVGEQAARLGEQDGVTPSAGLVPERLGDHRLAHPHRAVEDDRFARVEEAQRREVPDDRARHLRVEAEVELLEGDGPLEAGGPDPAHERRRLAPGDLVLAEGLEELQMPEVARVRLGEAGVKGVEHARETERAEGRPELVGPRHPTASSPPSGPSKRPRQPRRWAGTAAIVVGGVPSSSVPAARMPLTVR